jgi:hypothetical protein
MPLVAYNYDPDTFAYTNTTSSADPDPMEPGRYLIPAHSTLEVPPFLPDAKRMTAVWHPDEDKWVIELKASTPLIAKNIGEAPEGNQLYKSVTIKDALKAGGL